MIPDENLDHNRQKRRRRRLEEWEAEGGLNL